MKQTKVTANLDGLNELLQKMSGDLVTKVGVLGSSNARDDGDYGNADIGAVHEFGSISNNIPPRSFLRMPLETKRKELMKVFQSGSVKRAMAEGDYSAVFEIVGVKAEGIIQDAFATGGFGNWAANAPSTVAQKGSSAPLVDQGELRGAITSAVAKRSDV